MKHFDNGLEVLIIKYALGSAFVIVTLGFGLKVLILLSTVAKMKVASLLAGLQGSGWEWVYEGIKGIYERGAVK